MKRIQSACICQTLHFILKDEVEHDFAVEMVRNEVKKYKAELEEKRIRHRIVEEKELPDGSVLLKIIKQYNQNSVGDYLDV